MMMPNHNNLEWVLNHSDFTRIIQIGDVKYLLRWVISNHAIYGPFTWISHQSIKELSILMNFVVIYKDLRNLRARVRNYKLHAFENSIEPPVLNEDTYAIVYL